MLLSTQLHRKGQSGREERVRKTCQADGANANVTARISQSSQHGKHTRVRGQEPIDRALTQLAELLPEVASRSLLLNMAWRTEPGAVERAARTGRLGCLAKALQTPKKAPDWTGDGSATANRPAIPRNQRSMPIQPSSCEQTPPVTHR